MCTTYFLPSSNLVCFWNCFFFSFFILVGRFFLLFISEKWTISKLKRAINYCQIHMFMEKDKWKIMASAPSQPTATYQVNETDLCRWKWHLIAQTMEIFRMFPFFRLEKIEINKLNETKSSNHRSMLELMHFSYEAAAQNWSLSITVLSLSLVQRARLATRHLEIMW